MCGRYVSKLDAAIERYFEVKKPWFAFSSYNVAPSKDVPVVRQAEGGERELVLMRWGLIPYWAKDKRIGYKMINARSETLDIKPAFRQPFKRHRCLIPANGFYEWQKRRGGKVPYYIQPRDGSMMGFAGLWDIWKNPGGERVESCTIITTVANELVKPLHDRMPLIISPDAYGCWLTGNVDEASEVISTSASVPLEAYPVSTLVNKPENDDPRCIERVA
jgi:putative SOS response-associated peptidase YedK